MGQAGSEVRRFIRTTAHVNLTWVDSPVGPLILGATDDTFQLLHFADDPEAKIATLGGHIERNALLDSAAQQLAEYFAGTRREFDLPLAYAAGTTFQKQVWEGLRKIPYAQTWSYQAIANLVGIPDAVRAVGQANGMNPIAIIVPCHRCVNADGSLGGFGGGPWRKQHLLNHERGDVLF